MEDYQLLTISILFFSAGIYLFIQTRKISIRFRQNNIPKDHSNTIMLALIILIGILFIPWIFSNTIFSDYGKSNEIGDTIGGITAPFINGLSAVLVYLAFNAQVDANKLVQQQLEKQESDLKLEHFNKLELLTIDLESIIKDVELRAERMKEYYEQERTKPFELNLLKRTSSRVYSRIIEFERLHIYQGFKLFNSERDLWIPHYNKLYRIFDYLPDFFDSLYQIYDRHVQDIFEQKMSVRKRLIDLMEISVRYTEEFKTRYPMANAASAPTWSIANNLVLNYHQLINESFGPNGEQIKETDLEKMSEQVLKKFLTEAMKIKDEKIHFDSKIIPLLEVSSGIRKDIALIKQRAVEFSSNVEQEYNKLIIDDGENLSTLSEMKNLKLFIEQQMNLVELKNL